MHERPHAGRRRDVPEVSSECAANSETDLGESWTCGTVAMLYDLPALLGPQFAEWLAARTNANGTPKTASELSSDPS